MRSLLIMIYILAFGVSAALGQKYELIDGDTVNVTDANDLKQGTWRQLFSTGGLKQETTYKDGRKHGLDLSFYRFPNCMKEEAQYKNDTLEGYRILYYPNCKVRLMEMYSGGVKNGFVYTYNKHGDLLSEGFFRNGIKTEKKKKDSDKEKKVDLEEFLSGKLTIQDSTILKSLARIKPDRHTVIVTDVTGSMYPYVGQLLLWYSLTMDSSELEHFVFFNDGNEKPDLLKRVGRTGGIYMVNPNQLDNLKATMETAITNGSGGDTPENDMEAVVKGIKKFKRTKQVILIADRSSAVRDISLLRKVKVPVHVILCGKPDYTNVQYLDIAHRTNGNLYSLDEELDDVKGIKEGETIQIANLTFRFKYGKFRRVTASN